MTKTKCAHCREEFEHWRDYARHILDRHPDDKPRADWARSCLAEPSPELPKKRFRGRLFDRISPKRLPKYIQEQISGEESSDNKPD